MITSAPTFSQIPSISSYHSLLTTSAACKTYTSGSSLQPLSKNELDHYHLLRMNTLQKITKGKCMSLDDKAWTLSSLYQSVDGRPGVLGISRPLTHELEGKLLYPHEANLTIFSLLHPIDNAAISLSLHGNVITKPVVST